MCLCVTNFRRLRAPLDFSVCAWVRPRRRGALGFFKKPARGGQRPRAARPQVQLRRAVNFRPALRNPYPRQRRCTTLTPGKTVVALLDISGVLVTRTAAALAKGIRGSANIRVPINQQYYAGCELSLNVFVIRCEILKKKKKN